MHATRKAALNAWGLAALIALCPPPVAHAQGGPFTLTSGDAVTVSGAGTTGVFQGQPVRAPMSGYTSYTNLGGSFGVVTVGGTAAFTLASGATLTGDGVDACVAVQGSGPVTITGGSILATPPGASGFSPQAGFGVFANGTGLITITGGSLSGGQNGDAVALFGSNVVDITGGQFTSGLFGYGLFIGAFANGTIDLFGSGFVYTPSGGTATAITSGVIPAGSGTLTGTLLNGNALNTTYSCSASNSLSQLNVNVGPAPAPEPSQTAALGLGVLGLAGLALKARRRRTVA